MTFILRVTWSVSALASRNTRQDWCSHSPVQMKSPSEFQSYLSYKLRKQEILPQPTGVDSDGLVSLVAQHRHTTLT